MFVSRLEYGAVDPSSVQRRLPSRLSCSFLIPLLFLYFPYSTDIKELTAFSPLYSPSPIVLRHLASRQYALRLSASCRIHRPKRNHLHNCRCQASVDSCLLGAWIATITKGLRTWSELGAVDFTRTRRAKGGRRFEGPSRPCWRAISPISDPTSFADSPVTRPSSRSPSLVIQAR